MIVKAVEKVEEQLGYGGDASLVYAGCPFLDFRDPWGNRVEIVGYDNIQFTKEPNVLRGMGLMHLAKNEKAKQELAEKGMALE